MLKADSKVKYEDDKPEKYTNFEELVKRVEVLQEVIDEHAGILRDNDLVITEKKVAPFFDSDIVFARLEEDNE